MMSPMPCHHLIGTSVLGRHNLRSLRGAATFVDDVRLPGMQFLSFVRSPHPHAHIVSIVKDSAVTMKDVRCIVAASDLGLANEPLMAMVSVPQQLKQTTQRPSTARGAAYLRRIVSNSRKERGWKW